MKTVFEIMHGERRVVRIDTQGHCRIYDGQFMPYNLYLEENADDVDTLVNNVTNFYYWCASRVCERDIKQYRSKSGSYRQRQGGGGAVLSLCFTDRYILGEGAG